MISLVIGGDLCAGPRSTAHLEKGDGAAVFGELAAALNSADFALANLEGPLVGKPSPITKIGPHHTFPEDCIKGIRAAGFHLLNLGNNHTMDHGWVGLQNTIRLCEQNGLMHVGAGEDLNAAAKIWIQEIKGVRLAIMSLTEHEFGLATLSSPGTNPLDTIEFVRSIQAHRNQWDCLVILLHAGNEYYQYPRPGLQQLCRFMIEQGAEAVICQHSHCVGAQERYRDGYILYGQGNLLCDDPSQPCESEGVLVTLRISKDKPIAVELTPFTHQSGRPGPTLMTPPQRQQLFADLEKRSVAIQDPQFVAQHWEDFCQRTPYNYLGLLHGYPKRMRELDQKFPFIKRLHSAERRLMLLHLLRCQSHHEALMSALNATLK
ncbi:MAG: Bacterial capsule synthesis protein cap [Verrucomicrobiales bacterium]|nr:Bacterial capsule synthesis protein cap [Verrucomicrobiales bacterium]